MSDYLVPWLLLDVLPQFAPLAAALVALVKCRARRRKDQALVAVRPEDYPAQRVPGGAVNNPVTVTAALVQEALRTKRAPGFHRLSPFPSAVSR